MRARLWLCVMSLTLGCASARAEPTPIIPKDLWRILVRPHKPWVVRSEAGRVTVESYELHKVGIADVARLRWTFTPAGKGSESMTLSADQCRWTHVAVTDAGLYLLGDDDDDAAVLAAIGKKPARASPPKSYKPTRRNEGRLLTIDKGRVCWGWTNVSGNDCEETSCEGSVCVSPTAGVVYLDGTCAPEFEIFE